MATEPKADRRKTHGDETLVPEAPPELFRPPEGEHRHLDRPPMPLRPAQSKQRRRKGDAKKGSNKKGG
jgi:hypothetical protein